MQYDTIPFNTLKRIRLFAKRHIWLGLQERKSIYIHLSKTRHVFPTVALTGSSIESSNTILVITIASIKISPNFCKIMFADLRVYNLCHSEKLFLIRMCGDLSLEKQTSISRTNMNPTTEEILPEKVKMDSIVVSVFVVILFEFDKYWKILNQKQIQITIW